MDKRSLRCVMLVAYFGPWPEYFPFWARSCAANAPHFQWLLYTDQVRVRSTLNPAVELIPYSLLEMRSEIEAALGGTIPECGPRKVCDLRLLLYHARRERDRLEHYQYFGYGDLDMIFGNVLDALPDDLFRYSLLGAHDGHPTGPFTMIRADGAGKLLQSAALKEALCHPDYTNFDESPQLVEILKECGPAWLQAGNLQPSRNGRLPKENCFAEWSHGGLTVSDGVQREPAGFFHFAKLKGKRSFRVRRQAADSDRWMISRDGIYAADAPPWRVRLAGLKMFQGRVRR